MNINKAKNLKNQDWIDFRYENLKPLPNALGAAVDDLTITAVTWVRLIQLTQNNK